MPIFVVTGFPASYDPPEDESIVLPPGAGRRFKGVPFGVTEDTAAVLRTLAYLDEVKDEVDEPPPAPSDEDPPDPTTAPGELIAAAYATHLTATPVNESGLATGESGLTESDADAPSPQAEETTEPVPSGRARKSKE